MNFWEKSVVFLATGATVGLIPVAPGTFGTLLGIPVGFLLSGISLPIAIALLCVFIALAVWIAGSAERIYAQKDPGRIVIDEIAGMAVALVGLPFNTGMVVAAFVLFRVLDILKPPPIRWVESRLTGGAGVVMDDIVAGVMANLILRVGLLVLS